MAWRFSLLILAVAVILDIFVALSIPFISALKLSIVVIDFNDGIVENSDLTIPNATLQLNGLVSESEPFKHLTQVQVSLAMDFYTSTKT